MLKRVVLKLVFFAVLMSAVVAANTYVLNGPLLKSDVEASMRQFDGVPSTAGGFNVGGHWVPFNVVYFVEFAVLVMAGYFLFVDEPTRIVEKKEGMRNE